MSSWMTEFILAVVRAATPLVFCALSVIIAERSGITHIGVEGSMLIGAMVAVIATSATNSAIIGVLITLAAGFVLGVLLSIITVYLPTDQVVIGIAFNMTAVGITSYFLRMLPDLSTTTTSIIAPWFLGLSPFTIFAVILTIATWWFLSKTGPGLKLRSLGENAEAANSSGINVIRTRSLALIVASMLSALGGAALTIGWVRVFTENITQGRGFIALAAVYFGKWNPFLALLACVIFGAGEALAFRSQAMGSSISFYYFFMLPYLLTLVAAAISGKMKGPADCGKIYMKS